MYDVSILMPAIRTKSWLMLYGSLLNSCKRHTFELVLVSPFDLPDNMKQLENVKLIKDYGAPTRCAQIGAEHCEGRLMYHCVDDAIFLPDSIDLAIDFFDAHCGHKDVVNMRYREGTNYSGQTLPMQFWMAWAHDELRLPGIPQHYKISLHHMMNMEYFRELGGWDCQFEYINHPLHDLMFRVQADGGTLYDSPTDGTTCNHFIDKTGDHAPIFDAQTFSDKPIFDEMYSFLNAAADRIHLDLDNWKDSPEVWVRRFKEKEDGTLPSSYEEIL
jgi:hypothetical protein